MSSTDKVIVIFKSVGGAPMLKNDKVKVSRDSKFARIVDHLRRQLAEPPAPPPPLFCFLRSSFSPSLEEELGVLLDAFGTDGKLFVQYALTPAWG